MRISAGIFILVLFLGSAAYAQGVSVTVINYPKQVWPYNYFNPVWAVDAGGQTVDGTGVVWGTAPGGASLDAYPFKSVGIVNGGTYTTSINVFPYMGSQPWSVNWIYFRAYAIVGGRAYFSDEASLYAYNYDTWYPYGYYGVEPYYYYDGSRRFHERGFFPQEQREKERGDHDLNKGLPRQAPPITSPPVARPSAGVPATSPTIQHAPPASPPLQEHREIEQGNLPRYTPPITSPPVARRAMEVPEANRQGRPNW